MGIMHVTLMFTLFNKIKFAFEVRYEGVLSKSYEHRCRF